MPAKIPCPHVNCNSCHIFLVSALRNDSKVALGKKNEKVRIQALKDRLSDRYNSVLKYVAGTVHVNPRSLLAPHHQVYDAQLQYVLVR